ncbi:MAG: Methylpurine-DNA glycosylase, partial [Chloroflexota bacterium]|nr:Methylpurine-DNA glycosylase [Chloroflexota bacterium]
DPGSPLRLEAAPVGEARPEVVTTPRIGIDYAGDPWTARPWRFIERGHPSISGPSTAR